MTARQITASETARIIRQARVKIRLQGAREMRAFLAGEIDILPGYLDDRVMRAAVEQAYRAGQIAAARGLEHRRGG